jgi:uncharacterized membrane protein YsdA (DUF1294 family)
MSLAMKQIAIAYLAVVLVMSFVAFVFYGLDKRRARTDGRRVPETTLQLLALVGGWPGALLGQRVFRHKTQKLGFRIVFWLCVVLHLAAVGGAVYLLQSRG